MIMSKSYIATPPGEAIKEQLIDKGMSQKEFSARMNLSEEYVSRLIKGEVHLTPEIAMRLEMVLGVPASFWNNLEAIYRDRLAKIRDENKSAIDISEGDNMSGIDKQDEVKALKTLFSELEKGEISAGKEGWVSLEDAEKKLGI